MAITILTPTPAAQDFKRESSSEESDGGVDLEGDIDMRPVKKARYHASDHIVTPGEVVTDDPQWMRYELLLDSTIPSVPCN